MAATTLAVGGALYGANKGRKQAKKAAKAARAQEDAVNGILNPPREAYDSISLGMAKFGGGGKARDASGRLLYNTLPAGQPQGGMSPRDILDRFRLGPGMRGLPGVMGHGGGGLTDVVVRHGPKPAPAPTFGNPTGLPIIPGIRNPGASPIAAGLPSTNVRTPQPIKFGQVGLSSIGKMGTSRV